MPLAMMMICRTFISQTSNSSSSGSRQAREEPKKRKKKLVNKTSIFLGFPPISKMAKMAKMRLGGRKSCNSRFCLFRSRKLWIFKFYIMHQLKSSREISTKLKVSQYLVRSSRNDLSPHYLELRSTNIKDNFPLCALIYSISQNPSGHSRL